MGALKLRFNSVASKADDPFGPVFAIAKRGHACSSGEHGAPCSVRRTSAGSGTALFPRGKRRPIYRSK